MEKVKVQTPAGLLDEAKDRLGLTSDYKLALTLSWPFQTISGYRTGKRSMSVEHVREFSRVTGISLETVIDAAIAGLRLKAETRRTVDRDRSQKVAA